MSDDLRARRSVLVAIVLLAVVGGLILVDLLADYREGGSPFHLALETSVLVLSLGGAALLWRQLLQSRADLDRARSEAQRWRHEHQQLLGARSRT
jgi:hypothetical protein